MKKIDKIKIEDSLAFKNPKLSREWDYEKNYPLTPKDVYPNTHQYVFWKCSCGNLWNAQIQRRNMGYCKCKKCNAIKGSKKLFKGTKEFDDNCLANKNKKLAKEWNYKKNYPLTPHDVLYRGKKIYWWKCRKCGYEWKNRIDHRSTGYGNCIKCNSLATKRPDLLKEWDYKRNKGIDPFLINYHSVTVVNWICQKKHSWPSNVDNRTRKDFTPGCPYCSVPPRLVCIDNCLATLNPQLAKQWHPTKNGNLTPFDVTYGSRRKVWWECKKGHLWPASIMNRQNGTECPMCDGITLKNGIYCDSIPEAYMYLKYEKAGLKFLYRQIYGGKMGLSKYDFYFPDQNKYVEVTSYPETVNNPTSYLNNIVDNYNKKIALKKKYVESVLKAKFEFIRFTPTKKQIAYVKDNSK